MQPDLFDTTDVPVHQRHSATSRLAAEKVRKRAPSLEQLVYELLCREMLTDHEIARRLDRLPDSCRARRAALTGRGLVRQVGVGTSPSGNPAAIWAAVRDGEPPGPGTRRTPGAQAGGSQGAATTRPTSPKATAERAALDGLWSAIRTARPSWMSARQHEGIVRAATDAHAGDLAAGLRQALADLRTLGGGR